MTAHNRTKKIPQPKQHRPQPQGKGFRLEAIHEGVPEHVALYNTPNAMAPKNPGALINYHHTSNHAAAPALS